MRFHSMFRFDGQVAHAIVFLASKEDSDIAGASFVVDGGNILQEYKGPSENYY